MNELLHSSSKPGCLLGDALGFSPAHWTSEFLHTAGLAYPSSRAQRDTMRGADHAPLQEGPAPATEIDYNTRELLFTEIYLYNLGAGSILRLRY